MLPVFNLNVYTHLMIPSQSSLCGFLAMPDCFSQHGDLYQAAWHWPQNCCLTLVVTRCDCKIVVGVSSFISANVPSLNLCCTPKLSDMWPQAAGIDTGYCACS